MPLESQVETVREDTSTPTKIDASKAVDESGLDRLDRALAAAEKVVDDVEEEKIEVSIDTVDKLIGDVDESVKPPAFAELLKSASPEMKAALKFMQADYTRKTQKLSRANKEAEDRLAALSNSDFAKKLKEKAEQEVEFDPYDTESFNKRIEQEVAKRLQEMMAPIEEQHAIQQKRAALAEFKVAHPDMQTPELKDSIIKLLKANEHMSLETAYEKTKLALLEKQVAFHQTELAEHKRVVSEAGLKVGGLNRGRGNTVPEHIIKQGGIAIAEYLEQQANKR